MHGKGRCGGGIHRARVIAEEPHCGAVKDGDDGGGSQVGLERRQADEEGQSRVMWTRDHEACVAKLRELESAIKELREMAFVSF